MHYFKKQQSGVAIFMALFVVAVVTAISIVWYAQTRLTVKRTQEILTSEQAYLYAQGIVDWGINALIVNVATPKIFPPTTNSDQDIVSGRMDSYQNVIARNTMISKSNNNLYQDLFLLRADVRHGYEHLILYTLLHRNTIGDKVQVSIIWQSRGLE